jgi:hypothetical protein
LETAALPLELLAYRKGLDLALFMHGVFPASGAELGQLELVLLLATVLGRGVVPFFADRALHRDDASVATGHDVNPSKEER